MGGGPTYHGWILRDSGHHRKSKACRFCTADALGCPTLAGQPRVRSSTITSVSAGGSCLPSLGVTKSAQGGLGRRVGGSLRWRRSPLAPMVGRSRSDGQRLSVTVLHGGTRGLGEAALAPAAEP